MTEAGRISRMDMVTESTRKAARRTNVVWVTSLKLPQPNIVRPARSRMNRHNKALYPLIGAALLATPGVPMRTRDARFVKQWPAAGIARRAVRAVDGTLSGR